MPYTVRQDLVLRTLAPDDFSFDTIGCSARAHEKAAIFLDEVARSLFQLRQLHLSKKE